MSENVNIIFKNIETSEIDFQPVMLRRTHVTRVPSHVLQQNLTLDRRTRNTERTVNNSAAGLTFPPVGDITCGGSVDGEATRAIVGRGAHHVMSPVT